MPMRERVPMIVSGVEQMKYRVVLGLAQDPCASLGSDLHCLFQGIVCCHPVISIGTIALRALIAGDAEQSSADGLPLALGQGHGGQGLGVPGHEVWV